MEFKSVNFSYDKKSQLLKQNTGYIPDGKITTIIGPNGCGKSTLLSLLSRENKVSDGEITVNGKEIFQYQPKEFAKMVAMVYQQNEAPVDLTVEQLISFGRLPYKRAFKNTSAEDEEAVDWAINITNLESKRRRKLDQLSGGERQRVWIAMSLAQKTNMLFLDEPTTYLDIYYQMELLELVQTLNIKHNLTIVMVLHDINQALRYSDHLIVMKAGQIVAAGNPEAIVTEDMIKDIYGVDVALHTNHLAGMYLVPLGI
ncbi:ABC transporter ATP-binding protein [Cytobacillus horneckiae]|uniref:ABC transporter ATP-binding protein n=1 Tax=Cytobacillus horneckiae TaxID=549687 RepID=A0A2N0ZGC8_9BACI|nr:ABC transporter ATP-binding protein [Cytobacillus horneckiae]MEC1154776.1 ABC transporter ATP-binding protein [Cytobacillus horneckiae]MED2940270.1 ABC transporter ATP-binding protein [Cytobacillus horneckiae]PKG28570.1 ABC transporter ATP-binding protein [Cytobacillus horneckiae]